MPGSAEIRLLGLQIRTGDEKAMRTVVAVLKKHRGDVTKTAKELGVHRVTLHEWGRLSETLGALLEEHARGRIGRPVTKKKKARAKRRPARASNGTRPKAKPAQ